MFYISYYLSEIKSRVFYIIVAWVITFLFSYFYKLELIYIISRPFLQFKNKFIFLDLPEAFQFTIQTCLVISFIIIIPYVVYQFWSFYVPSQYYFERRFILRLVIFFNCLFFCEVLYLYTNIFPLLCNFLMSFEIKTLDSLVIIELAARIQSYLSILTRFFLLGLCFFQVPFFFIFLFLKTSLNCYKLCKNRKIFLLIAILISAFISPPDFVSQSFLCILLVIFYEFLVFIGFFFNLSKDI